MSEWTENPYDVYVNGPDLPPPEPPKVSKPRFSATCASEIQDSEIRYLWKPYILRGDVTIMAAAGGTGKTFALCGIAAELSNGRYPLNPFDRCEPARVLFISAEDPDFILRQRMRRAGADLDRIYVLDASASARLKLADFAGQPDLNDLERLIAEVRADLVIVDPLHAFVGSSVKMTEQSAIRPFMQALATLAKKHDCAIIDVAHVNKRPAGSNANDAILGATDIVNASRSVIRVIFDETGTRPNRRVLVHTKSNYAAPGQSVAFEIDGDGRLQWTGFSEVTRSDLEAAARSNKSLSEHLNAEEAARAAAAFVADKLEALAKEQTEPLTFYSYDTLRTHGIGGRSEILPALPLLKERGIEVRFPNQPRRNHTTGETKRGIVLISAATTQTGCV